MASLVPDAEEARTHLQLGEKAMASFDVEGAIGHLSRAVRELTAAGDRRGAALAASRLGFVLSGLLGNKTAARPWFTRAFRLLEGEEPCVELGWVAVASMGCQVDDPRVLTERADLAVSIARTFGDIELEAKALADGGLARVHAGAVADGMAMLDEAMALSCGGGAVDDLLRAQSVCSFFTACWYAADLERFRAWTPVLRQHGLIGQPHNIFLNSHCDSVQGTLLCHAGQWQAADDVLSRALATIQEQMPGGGLHPASALADLRILQGRLAEAEALLLGQDHLMEALLPTARLHLAQGDFDLACATAQRGLALLGDDRMRGPALLGVVAEAELGRGDVGRATEAADALERRVAGLDRPAIVAEAGRVRARVLAASGRRDEAVAALRRALMALGQADGTLVQAWLHIELARQHIAAGDDAAAVVEARAAASIVTQLDVVLQADDAAVLRSLDVAVTTARPRAGCRVATLSRDGGWWTIGCDETRLRLQHTKGLAYLAELVASPGIERHVIDLVDRVEGVATDGVDRRRLGDAGELLDERGRAAYRRRIEELRSEIDHDLGIEDDDAAMAKQGELDALVGELSRAFGMGGEARRASSVAERARLNVTRALRAAVVKIADALPDAGGVLDRRLRTGLFCAYEPHADDDVLWSVQS
jgi:tetratricopeptide (TPR) repeat protein